MAEGWRAGPVIETPRLRLRLHRPDDLPGRQAITQDEAVMRFIGGQTQDREDNWNRLLRYAGHWALFGYGLFAVEERDSGRFAGEIGLADFARGLGEDFDSAPEAAWMLAGWASGRGYAREGMAAVIDWFERTHGLSRLVCMIAPDNAPSLHLAAHLGFLPFRDARYHDHDLRLLQRGEALPNAAQSG